MAWTILQRAVFGGRTMPMIMEIIGPVGAMCAFGV